jgi:hypothetical protein
MNIGKTLFAQVMEYTCLQILSECIFEKTELSCALQPYDYTVKIQDNPRRFQVSSATVE